MRRLFALLLEQHMSENNKIRLVLADVGYKMFDSIRARWSARVYDVGAAEQCAVGVAVGLALAGLVPVVYTISPFLIYRPFEWISLYMEREGIPVKLVGSGHDKDYLQDGPTHWMGDVPFKNIRVSYGQIIDDQLASAKPEIILLQR
jgi:transketolase